MDRNSYLDGDSLSLKCTQHVEYLNREIEFLYRKEQVLDWQPDDAFGGNRAQAFLDSMQKFDEQYIKKLIEADKELIGIYTALGKEVYGVHIVGSEVLDKQEEAKRKEEECDLLADEYLEKACNSVIAEEIEHFRNLAKQQERQSQEWSEAYEFWLEKEGQYDEIDAWFSKMIQGMTKSVTPGN